MNGHKKFKYFDPQDLKMEHMWLIRKDLQKKFDNSSARNYVKPQLIKEILNYEFPNKFSGCDVIEVDNIFNIKI